MILKMRERVLVERVQGGGGCVLRWGRSVAVVVGGGVQLLVPGTSAEKREKILVRLCSVQNVYL